MSKMKQYVPVLFIGTRRETFPLTKKLVGFVVLHDVELFRKKM